MGKELNTLISEFEKARPKNEMDARLRFLDHFFMLLGWDLANKEQKIEAYRDVLVEDRVSKKHAERPDYTFKLQRTRKFFVEAKKPGVDISERGEPAFQIRQYGHWAKLQVCILTNFEEFAVYDTRYRPKKTDKADTHRRFYCRYTKYPEEWDFIRAIFSKQAVAEGSLEKFVGGDKRKTTSIDDDFLAVIEEWRKNLAANVALQNRAPDGRSALNIFDLNLAVQTIIDRIIFLKFAESRGMEAPEHLEGLEKTTGIYAHLDKLFLQANKKYNSGLFKRDEDREFIAGLNIGDTPLRKILQFLRASGYGFQVLPIEILGSIYERFLGKTIYFTKEERAKIEEKPETRKAGGVYYTPEYIVSYIVENTLGEVLKNKKPQEAEKIRVLDPACGSGSFLVNAYDKLLNWHLDYYSQSKNVTKALKEKKIYEVKGQKSKTYRLSITEKQHILLNNIYGVDIDRQAVEVSKLSLLLKLMEDEDIESEEELFKHSDIQILPDLSNNIQCGNSLIGSDFYKEKQASLFPVEERLKINAFDWDGPDGFPAIMKAGGFDVVIGNPPWGAEFANIEKVYLKNEFTAFDTESESYIFFIERSHTLLNKNGFYGMIIPSNLFTNIRYNQIRKYLLNNICLKYILDLGSGVFENVSADSGIITYQNQLVKTENILNGYKMNVKSSTFKETENKFKIYWQFSQKEFSSNQDFIFNIYTNKQNRDLIRKIDDEFSSKLKEYSVVYRGVEYGYSSEYIESKQRNKNYKPIIAGRCFNRYVLKFENKYVNFNQNDPSNFKEKFIYEKEKILLRRIGKSLIAVYDKEKYYNVCDVYNILMQDASRINIKFLLSLINSKFISFYYINKFSNAKILFPKIPIKNILQLPIPNLNLYNPIQKAQHDRMVAFVDQMLATQKKLHDATSPSEKAIYKKNADGLDREIDALVYELYGLTEKEIKIVEGVG